MHPKGRHASLLNEDWQLIFGACLWESKLSDLVSKQMKGSKESWERCLNQVKHIVMSDQTLHNHF